MIFLKVSFHNEVYCDILFIHVFIQPMSLNQWLLHEDEVKFQVRTYVI